MKILISLLCILAVVYGDIAAQTQITNLVEIENARRKELIGYGLVTGLDRTGDRSTNMRGAVFTVQSIANMLQNFGINIDPDRLRTRNVAAVMVTATLSPYHAPGSEIDVAVSSLGDASSLQGGVLLQTPLLDPDNEELYAKAQGPLIVGGINAEIGGARIAQNQTLTATIPGGAVVEQNTIVPFNSEEPLGLVLREPSFGNARSITEKINETFDEDLAIIEHAGLVKVDWPAAFQDKSTMNIFTSLILEQEVLVKSEAKVVINERTGTIVAGGEVVIDEAMIAHGNIQIRTQEQPFVSQPNILTGGQTVSGVVPEAGITEQEARTIVLEPETTVRQLAASLNAIGLSPRDIIAIFQALERAGVLRGKLIVM